MRPRLQRSASDILPPPIATACFPHEWSVRAVSIRGNPIGLSGGEADGKFRGTPEASPRFSSRSVGVFTSPLPRCRAPYPRAAGLRVLTGSRSACERRSPAPTCGGTGRAAAGKGARANTDLHRGSSMKNEGMPQGWPSAPEGCCRERSGKRESDQGVLSELGFGAGGGVAWRKEEASAARSRTGLRPIAYAEAGAWPSAATCGGRERSRRSSRLS